MRQSGVSDICGHCPTLRPKYLRDITGLDVKKKDLSLHMTFWSFHAQQKILQKIGLMSGYKPMTKRFCVDRTRVLFSSEL